MRRLAILVLLLAALATAGGCAFLAGGAIGAAGYRYVQGSFSTTYHQPYEQVYNTTLTTLKDLNMPVTGTQKDALGAQISAKRADGTPISVSLERKGPDQTDANIRVGRIGDESASKVIADNIAQRLGEPERGRGGK